LALPSEVVGDWGAFAEDFGFFVLVVTSPAPDEPYTVIHSWPRSAEYLYQEYEHFDPAASDFEVAWWGKANRTDGAQANGIWIDRSDVGSAVDPASVVDLGAIPEDIDLGNEIKYDTSGANTTRTSSSRKSKTTGTGNPSIPRQAT
jgi:hypothetical protein